MWPLIRWRPAVRGWAGSVQCSRRASAVDASTGGKRGRGIEQNGRLTGRGSAAPNLLDRLTGIVAVCRSARRPLSLLLVKLSAGDELLTACGPQEVAAMRRVLGKVCGQLDHPGTISLPHTEFGYALILPDAERRRPWNWATSWSARSAARRPSRDRRRKSG